METAQVIFYFLKNNKIYRLGFLTITVYFRRFKPIEILQLIIKNKNT